MRWPALGLLAVLTPVAPQDNLVNERVPVDRPALERHWGLDCSAVVLRVRAAMAAPASGRPTPETETIGSDLSRCATLDKREAAGTGRHQRLFDAYRRWRGALAAGRSQECMEARRALEALLDGEFDLYQGAPSLPAVK